jgi:hypothetical protein
VAKKVPIEGDVGVRRILAPGDRPLAQPVFEFGPFDVEQRPAEPRPSLRDGGIPATPSMPPPRIRFRNSVSAWSCAWWAVRNISSGCNSLAAAR